MAREFETRLHPARAAIGCLLALVCSAAGVAGADDLEPTPEQVTERTEGLSALWDALRGEDEKIRVRIDSGLVSTGNFAGAQAWWVRSGVASEVGFPVTDRAFVGFSPGLAWERLAFDGSDEFVTSVSGRETRFTDFLDAALRFGGSHRFDDGFGAELVLAANLRQEVGAAFDESLRVGGSLAGTYRRGKWLRMRLGFGLGADLGDGKLRISPVYRIQLRPHRRLLLESSGLNGAVEWDATKRTRISLSAGLDGKQYRLDRQRPPPNGLGSGTLQRRQTHLTLGARHRLRSWIRIGLELGLVVDQELTVIDEDGVEVDARRDRDPTAQAMLRIELRL